MTMPHTVGTCLVKCFDFALKHSGFPRRQEAQETYLALFEVQCIVFIDLFMLHPIWLAQSVNPQHVYG